MAGRWHDFGQYNARGVTGANALGAGIEHMVTGLSSSPDSERGVAARLRYLTASASGYAAIERAGIHVTARTLYAWLAEERMPSRETGPESMTPTGTCAATTSPPTSNAA